MEQLFIEVLAKIEEMRAQFSVEQKAKYDEGFAAGVGSVSSGNPKIYSQEELDAVVIPMREQIAALQVEVDSIPSKIEAAKSESIAAFKAELLAKYEEKQVVESQAETGFAELLK